MTELDLDRLEAVAKAATPGPWSVWRHDDARLRFVSDGKENLADEVEPKDAAHIAAFERAWYGRHEVTRETVDEFRQRSTAMKSILQPKVAA